MKLRNGFVSNSSSSSFIVYGFGNSDVLLELYDTVTSIINYPRARSTGFGE